MDRIALWFKLLQNNIDGNVFRVIHNMYEKAKSCVMSGNDLSSFFGSSVGVRQGENSSPILFSIFLNDLTQFMSKYYDGLNLLTDEIHLLFDNQDCEVYFKLYLLLYADGTVIFAETAHDLQKALNAMQRYCDMWNLKINASKTKIVIFSKGKLRNKPDFVLINNHLEVVDDFDYLGVRYNFNGKFAKNKKRLIDQARKAMFSLMKKSRKLSLPIDIQLHLFESMIVPILFYGSEVWVSENVDIINQFQLKFCKMLLGLKQSTPNIMIYGELGITPLNLSIENRILNFWAWVVNGKPDKISAILYKLAYELHKKNIYQSPWITYVKSSLDGIGLSDNWLSQTVNNIYTFKTRVKSVLHDNFTQSWKSKIFESSKCINHRIYKDTFKFEGYLNLLPFSSAKVMCKFRS